MSIEKSSNWKVLLSCTNPTGKFWVVSGNFSMPLLPTATQRDPIKVFDFCCKSVIKKRYSCLKVSK